MANAILSPSFRACQNLCSATFGRSSRTSKFGCELQARPRRSSRCAKNLRVRASEEGKDDGDDVGELENALGVEMKTVRRKPTAKDPSRRRPKSVLDVIEEQIQQKQANMLPDNAFFRTLTQISEWLIDKTENSGGQDNVVIFAFVFFPFWVVALLVTSGAIQLPFELPFIHLSNQHIK